MNQTIAAYFSSQKEVVAVYLYGSHAKGGVRPSSDLDIGILLDEKNLEVAIERRNHYMVELGRVLRKDIHPVILNSASEELLRQIFSKGTCILINDARKLARYKMVMFARIADFGYYRDQMQAGFIRKVMEG